MKSTVLLLSLLFCSDGLKVLILAPAVTKSIVNFNSRFACALTEGGHNVTLVSLLMSTVAGSTAAPCPLTQVDINITSSPADLARHSNIIQNWTFDTEGRDLHYMLNFQEHAVMLNKELCEMMIGSDVVQALLMDASFDHAITVPLAYCPNALLEEQIMPYSWFIFGNYISQNVAEFQQVPYPPSYVPDSFIGFSAFMSFKERLTNFLLVTFIGFMLERSSPEMDVFRITPRDTSLVSARMITYNRLLMMMNGDIMLDFPRPMGNSFLYLGALHSIHEPASKSKQKARLPEEWNRWITNQSRGLIVFSFGSIVNTDKMPDQLKLPFALAFEQFKDYQIAWKVDSPIQSDVTLVHIKMAKWLPQKELLAHPKTKLFLTHGGYNSLLEACQSGVPIITIPLNLDQYGNAKRAERLGLGVTLDKRSLSVDSITSAMNEVLRNTRYRKRAKAMSRMISDTPIRRERLFLHIFARTHRHYDVINRFTQIHYLPPLQYFLVDIVAAAVVAITVLAFVIKRSTKITWRLINVIIRSLRWTTGATT